MVRLRALYEKVRSSLFWVPAGYIIVAVGLAAVATLIDLRGRLAWLSPVLIEADADSARAVLQTVATATITVAGLVFPVMVVALQLASSQFSPRVLRGFLRDRILQHVLGVVVGTFTFSVLVLANSPLNEGRDPETAAPSFAVTTAVVLAVASALAIVEFIHHAARNMQVVEIIRRTTMETRERIAGLMPDLAGERPPPEFRDVDPPSGPSSTVRAAHDGWVQQMDQGALLRGLPPGSVVRVDAYPGHFVVEGQPLCTVWLADRAVRDDLSAHLSEAFAVGSARTMQQDVVFGIRQIVDIALRALSPAVNDPTTAYEVTVNLGAILRDILLRDLPARVHTDDRDRTILRPRDLTHAGYVGQAFDQLRLAAARHPVAAINLLETIATLVALVREAGLDDRLDALLEQVDLTVAATEANQPLPHDLEKVRAAARRCREVASPAQPLVGSGRER